MKKIILLLFLFIISAKVGDVFYRDYKDREGSIYCYVFGTSEDGDTKYILFKWTVTTDKNKYVGSTYMTEDYFTNIYKFKRKATKQDSATFHLN